MTLRHAFSDNSKQLKGTTAYVGLYRLQLFCLKLDSDYTSETGIPLTPRWQPDV